MWTYNHSSQWHCYNFEYRDSSSIKTLADMNPVELYFHTQDYQANTIIK